MGREPLYASPPAYQILGYTHEEYLALNGLEYVHPADQQLAMEALA